jgi:DNA-binding beta-propeller fold protein YncE
VWRVAAGAVQFVAGAKIEEGGTGPYTGAPLNPLFEALDPEGRFLFTAASPGPGPTPGVEFRAIATNADGTLGAVSPRQRDLCGSAGHMAAAAGGSLAFVYNTCTSDHLVQWTVFNVLTGNVVSTGQISTPGSPADLIVDPSGRFLLVADSGANAVEEFTIDQSNGALNQSQTAAAGTAPAALTFDSTGTYVYAANSGSNNISGFRFSNGSLQPIGTFASGASTSSIAVVKP